MSVYQHSVAADAAVFKVWKNDGKREINKV
jgi:hypothetical protein